MARVNVGVNPKYLSDQHLIAESVEITMITGNLRLNDYIIKSKIPQLFKLGKGHINFFKNKLLYLHNRLSEVNNEMDNRNFKNSTIIKLEEFPIELINNWIPEMESSQIVRSRIVERLFNPKSKKINLHRYHRIPIDDMIIFSNNLINSELFIV